jgi:uncharacterized membrane protein
LVPRTARVALSAFVGRPGQAGTSDRAPISSPRSPPGGAPIDRRYVGPVPPPGDDKRPDVEDDASKEQVDNSLGRLLTLCDGVFAIAITLLTFDLRVPAIATHASDSSLRHALAHQSSTYLSFFLSFFVISRLWGQHRRVMRAVVATHPRLIRDTIWLLFVVAAMPFLTDLLGSDGSKPTALALYGFFNAVAILLLMQLARGVRKYDLLDHRADATVDPGAKRDSWRNVAVFLLCVPAAYLLGHNGPWLLVLLAVPTSLGRLGRVRKRHRVQGA